MLSRLSLSLVVVLALSGCGGGGSHADIPASATAPSVPSAPIQDLLRSGDKITIRLTGVPDGEYIIEVEIPPSGDVTVPLLVDHPFRATGRTASDLANDISNAYRTGKIYTNPTVVVIPEERFVNVGGDVRSPQRVPFTADLTLLSAINSCGGFTEYANKRQVRIIRGTQAIYINASVAAATPGADPHLYPGDQIFVPRTIF